MINTNIVLSKIGASPTDQAWSQVYSTLNLYIVLGLETESIEEQTIASIGKETLERIQREFFALDQKDLKSIKHAVEEAVKTIPHHTTHSILLATIVENILYIVIAGKGHVVIKRGKDIGVAARQTDDHHVTSYSGFLEDHDTVVIGTDSFFEKVTIAQLATFLHEGTVTEQAENIAPIIQGNAIGTEAALLLSYRHHTATVHEAEKETTEEEEKTGESKLEDTTEAESISPRKFPIFKPSIPQIEVPNLLKKRGVLIGGAIVILALILVVSIFIQKKHSKQAAADEKVQSIISSAQQKYDEAQSLMSLNKSLANDELKQTEDALKQDRSQFPDGSSQQKQIDAFIAKIDSTLGGSQDATAVKNQKVVYDGSGAVKQIGAITFKGGVLAVADASSGKVLTLNPDGTEKDTLSSDAKSVSFISGDKNTIVELASDGIYKIDRGSKSGSKAIPLSSTSGFMGIDTFLGNIYVLNTSGNSIDKYPSGSTTKSSYLASGQTLANTPLSFSIDSSVWVIEKGGNLERFTKGKSDGIAAKGIPNALGSHLQIYTDENYTGVYILDSDNGRVVALDKNGAYTTQYTATILKGATGLAVDETDKKIFVISSNKLYSFDL